MADWKNGRWAWLAIVASAIAALATVAAFVGVPSCSEIQTVAEAKEDHTAIRTEAVQMIKALKALTKVEKERRDAEHKSIEQRLDKADESDVILRARTWEILQEVKK